MSASATDAVEPAAAAPLLTTRRRWVRPLTVVVMVGLIGVSTYLVVVSHQWKDRVDHLTTISEDLGAGVADARAAQSEAEAALTATQAELDTATARITALSNEKANATDHESVLTNYVDAMISCADGRAQVIRVLTGRYVFDDGKSAATHANELDDYCAGVAQDYHTFTSTELGQ